MTFLAACVATLLTIAHANNGPTGTESMLIRHYARLGITVPQSHAERLRVALDGIKYEGKDHAELLAVLREPDRFIVTDMGAYGVHRADADLAMRAKLNALRAVGIEPEEPLLSVLREQAECEADAMLSSIHR